MQYSLIVFMLKPSFIFDLHSLQFKTFIKSELFQCFWKKSLLHLFDQKQSKNMKYYYYLK